MKKDLVWCYGRNTGDENCKAGEYRLVTAGGRGILDGGRTGILNLESLLQSRAFCWEVHPLLIEKQQTGYFCVAHGSCVVFHPQSPKVVFQRSREN